jgi:hypothetical protein
MKAKTFFFSVAAGVVTLAVWEFLKPKVQQLAPEQQQESGGGGIDWWPFD